MSWIIAIAILCGLAAALFARLCDAAMAVHTHLYEALRWPVLLLLPAGFGIATWLTENLHPKRRAAAFPR